jgi:hypothetical protein
MWRSCREGTNATAILDWKDGRLVGIEVLDASERVHPDLFDEAEDITNEKFNGSPLTERS